MLLPLPDRICTSKMIRKLLMLTLCFSSAFYFAVQGDKIEDRLSDTEYRRIFHRSRSSVPDYKTVVLETSKGHRTRRDLRPVEFEIDGTEIQLSLHPVKENVFNYSPVWTVETDTQSSSGRRFQRLSNDETNIDGIFYEDSEKMAMLLAYYKNQFIYYDGIVGESDMTKIVRSLPEKWWKTSGTDVGDDHVVFGVNGEKGTTNPIGASSGSEKLHKPLDIFYPKLLLVVSNELFKKLGKDVKETVKYVLTFWNAVNLRYSKLTSPEVKILITGIIIAKDETSLSYIYNARVPEEMEKLNTVKLLKDGNDYFLKEFKKDVDFSNYDATITITSLNTGVIAGSAYIEGICEPTANTGFIRDDASFSGIQTATHELGHLLGLPHDGQGDAVSCDSYSDSTVGTIMAPFAASVEKYVWSECSKKILQKFASSRYAQCMKDRSRT